MLYRLLVLLLVVLIVLLLFVDTVVSFHVVPAGGADTVATVC